MRRVSGDSAITAAYITARSNTRAAAAGHCGCHARRGRSRIYDGTARACDPGMDDFMSLDDLALALATGGETEAELAKATLALQGEDGKGAGSPQWKAACMRYMNSLKVKCSFGCRPGAVTTSWLKRSAGE
jgi:hypothetical protein